MLREKSAEEMISTPLKYISSAIKIQKMKIARWGVWEKIRVKDGIYMGVGGIILRTRLCADGSESFGQFICFDTFYYQSWIQINQE